MNKNHPRHVWPTNFHLHQVPRKKLLVSAGECVYFQFNQFSLICQTTLLRQSASSFRNICHLRTEIITLLEKGFSQKQWVENMYLNLRKASGEILTRFANKGNFSYSRLWFARRKSQVPVNPFLTRRTCYFISVIFLDNFRYIRNFTGDCCHYYAIIP